MTTEDRKILGERIKKLRNEKGLSLRAFGEMIGMSKDYLVDVEHGRKSPTLDSLLRISGGLGISLSKLVDGLGIIQDGDDPDDASASYFGTAL